MLPYTEPVTAIWVVLCFPGFQYFMNDIFQDLLAHFGTACLPDILIYYGEEAPHTEQDQMVLAPLH